MIKACIFDLDGTVADTLTTIAYFANEALKKFGFPAIETEKYKILVGNGAKVLVRRMFETVGAPEEMYDEVLSYYVSTYDQKFMYLTTAFDGIIDMLQGMKAKGIKTAIVSNKPDSTTCKISEELFGDLIDLCRGGREGVPLKPDPQAVVKTMDALHVSPEECLYVGDTGTDMKTGKNAGIYTIGVTWGFRGEQELRDTGADVIVYSPAEILAIATGGESRE
ncbi:MAG: HAD family hydrolase [Lachnospiraceae bacterium]|nr:HAD family hydrolase [Lachnospiraceae bacterium]